LQDAAILQPMFPAHPIWAHDVFRHPLYAPFAERVRFQHSNSPESTREQQLAAAVPAVAAQLQTLRQEQSHQLATLRQEHASQLATLQRTVDRTQRQNQQILNQLRGYRPVPLPGHGSEGSLWAEPADVGGGPAAAAAATPTPYPTMADDSLPLASSGELDPIPDPAYRMSRQATTVAQLYTEWFTGLGDKPSVVQMDRQFGTKWRSENKEKVFYSVRKTIIDHVQDRRRGGESLDAVLRHLQGAMVARSKGLQALSLAIRNWQDPGARKKKDEVWYEGPGTGHGIGTGLKLSFSLSLCLFLFLLFLFLFFFGQRATPMSLKIMFHKGGWLIGILRLRFDGNYKLYLIQVINKWYNKSGKQICRSAVSPSGLLTRHWRIHSPRRCPRQTSPYPSHLSLSRLINRWRT
jgi:Transcriptional activator of glycolytic enzymes